MTRKDDSESPAAALARMRWDKASAKERKQVGEDLANARWGGKTEEERKAIGKHLAEARKKARNAKSKKEKVP
jgi:hypothetical protein